MQARSKWFAGYQLPITGIDDGQYTCAYAVPVAAIIQKKDVSVFINYLYTTQSPHYFILTFMLLNKS